jgi:arylsulfatase A-like enzyme
VALALTLVACACAPAEPPRERPNIVLVLSDDQDRTHLGFAGHPVARTPALDRWAAQGTVFRNGHTAPRCRPTLAGLLTGRLPHQTGVTANQLDAPLGARALEESLPALLERAGYATYAEGKYWEGDPRAAGFGHGPLRAEGERFLNEDGFVREGQDELFRFLDSVGDRPFFVWYAPQLPHEPRTPPERFTDALDPRRLPVPTWVREEDRRDFVVQELISLGMVSWLDEGLSELQAKLASLGLERDTLVVFLIDNGWANGAASKGTPYERGVSTPFLFHAPGWIEPGRVRDELVSFVDVMPTLLDFAGVEAPEGYAGRSLRPLLEGEATEERAFLAGACYPVATTGPPEGEAYALYARDARWKYVRWLRDVRAADNDALLHITHRFVPFPAHARGEEELFDLAADPNERVDLAGDPARAQELARLRETALAWWRRTGGAPFPE